MTSRAPKAGARAPLWARRLILGCTAGLGFVCLMRFIPAQMPYPLSAVEAVATWLLLPAWPLLAFALWARFTRIAAALIVIAFTHAMWCGDWIFGMQSELLPGGYRMRVVAANLLAPSPSRALADELVASNADLLITEELSNEWLALLEEKGLVARFPHKFVEAHSTSRDYFGLGVFSRYPILSQERIDFGVPQFPLMRVDLEVEGRRVRVFAVHTVPPTSNTFLYLQAKQNDILLSRLFNDTADTTLDALVVAGDFNMSPTTYQYRRFAETGLASAHELAGQGFATTWPNGMLSMLPMRLDHIFLSGASVLALHHGRGEGSDHAPLVVDLSLSPVRRAAAAQR